MPGIAPLFSGDMNTQALLQAGVYLLGFVVALIYVLSTRSKSLRTDANIITRFNTYLIRAFFWAVLFVGLADMAISFLRVEGLLGHVTDAETIKQLGRSVWRGTYIHLPAYCPGLFCGVVYSNTGVPLACHH